MNRSILSFFILLAFTIAPSGGYAQNVTLGTRSGAASTAVLLATSTSTTSKYARTASIYTASEILAAGGYAGEIRKLWWSKEGTGEYLLGDATLKVYIKHVAITAHTATVTWATDTIGSTMVYSSNTYSIPAGTGWKELTFNTPFVWDGVNNIEIMVDWFRPGNPTAAIDWARSTGSNTNASVAATSAPATMTRNANRPLLQLEIVNPTATDAALKAIISPSVSFPAGTQNIDVIIKNQGGVDINDLELEWEIDGTLQPVFSHTFTPALASLAVSSSITIGGYNFPFGFHTIRIWTKDPNGTADADKNNDTLSLTVLATAPMQGVYTIDPSIPSSTTNFISFTDAVNAVNNNGISGSVYFDVPANSTFTESRILLTATGTATDSITFRKAGTGNNPLITAAAGTSTTRDFIIGMEGSDHITFDGINVQDDASNSSTTTQMEWGYALFTANDSLNGCQYITIKNCRIELLRSRTSGIGIYSINQTAGATTTMKAKAFSGSNSFNSFYNDSVINCYSGIVLSGTNDSNYYDDSNKIGVDGGNIILNLAGAITSSNGGIYITYQDNAQIANNTIHSGTGVTNAIEGINTGVGLNSNIDIHNNTVTIISSTTSACSVILNGIGAKGSTNTINIYNNHVLNCFSRGELNLIENSSLANTVNIHHNLIENDSNKTGTLYGILNASATGDFGSTINIHDNTIRNLGRDSTGTGLFAGIRNAPLIANTVSNIYKNEIYGLSALQTSGTLMISGINIYGATTQNVYQNKVYDISIKGSTGKSAGLVFFGSVSAGCNAYFYNNYVSDIKAPASSDTNAVTGISVNFASAVSFAGIYHNTIYLNASSSASSFGSSGIYVNTTTPVDIRNNIVVNNSIPGIGAGVVAAYKRSSTSLATYAATSNRNIFYAGIPGNRRYIYSDGIDSAVTMGAYKTKVSPRDAESLTTLPQFIDTTTLPYDLNIDPSVPTAVEGNAEPMSSPVAITTDFYGNTRDALTPDIGAQEGTFIPADLGAPSIVFTPLKNTGSLLGRTISVTISDPSGIDSSANGRPLIYYRKNLSGFITDTAISRSGNEYVFAMNYTTLGAAAAGDVIDYYVAAQDLSPFQNVGTSPDGGSGITPPGNTPPSTFASYTILNTLSGTYYVGTTPHSPTAAYSTLKDALIDYKANGMAGSVEFVLIDPVYDRSTGETIPILIEENPDASPINTLTIKPEINTNISIIDTSVSAIVKLSGADHVIIDGVNNNGSSLTIINNDIVSAANTVVWIASAGADNGATHNSIRNCNIHGYSTTETLAAIYSGTGMNIGVALPAQTNNHGNTIDSNYISKAKYGVAFVGYAAAQPDINSRIINNRFGSSVTGDGFHLEAIRATSQDSITISNNDIQNIFGSEVLNPDGNRFGISMNNNRNAQITSNKIHHLIFNGAAYVRIYGISSTAPNFKTILSPSNNSFINNIVYDISSTSSVLTDYNGSGINVNDGYGDRFYHNTVYLTGQLGGTGNVPFAAFSNGNDYTTAFAHNIDVRNNVFAVTGYNPNNNSKLYAHYTTATDYTTNILSNNVLYVNVPAPTTGYTGYFNGANHSTLAAWQAATANETNSLGSDPMLNTPYVLIPQTGSVAIGSGTPLAGVTTDIDGNLRSGTAPSMGAYEIAGDFKGPEIVFTPIKNTTLLANRVLTDFATITDNSGVNTTAGSGPRIYYRKTSDLNAFNGNTSSDNGWKWTEATNAADPFSFEIDYSLLNGGTININDTLVYFIAAQDNSPAASVNSSALLFNQALSVDLDATHFPVENADTFRIIPGAQGYVYVGAGQPYLSLTGSGGMFQAIREQLILTGDLTVLITSDLTEDGTYDITDWDEEGTGGYKIFFRPDQNILRTITGNVANGMIRLNGATNIVFDGIDTVSGTGKYLQFINQHTSNPVFTFINDAVADTLRNCIVSGANTSTLSGIVFFGTSTGGGNNFHQIANNDIRNISGNPRCGTGVYSGGSILSRNKNNTITGNNVFNFEDAGIYVSSNNGGDWNISDNHIFDSVPNTSSATTAQAGIEFFAASQNNTISNNYIGGQGPFALGNSWNNSGNNAFVGITASFDTLGTNLVTGNVVKNIQKTSIGTSATFTGIRVSRGDAEISNNLVGDTLVIGEGISSSGSAIMNGIEITNSINNAHIYVRNNQVANISAAGTTANVKLRGISYNNSTSNNTLPLTIADNKIFNLYSFSQATGTAAGDLVITGIYCFPNSFSSVNITSNTIHDLFSMNTSDTPSIAAGMMVTNFRGNISTNRIYHIRNYSSRNNAANPAMAAGMAFRASDQLVISNNMITAGYDTTDNIQYIGLWNPFTSGGAGLYHNTIVVKGQTSSDVPSYGFFRGNNNPADSINSPVNGNNNIFHTERNASHSFAIGNNSSVVHSSNGWGNQSWDNNIVYSSFTGLMLSWNGVPLDLPSWQTVSQKDSQTTVHSVAFENTALGDLHLGAASFGDLALMGKPLANITTDFDGEIRSVTFPYIGADENPGFPLPVTLNAFSAKRMKKDVLVYWNTTSEINTDKFIIEASVNGKDFKQIGQVTARGNSASVTDYQWKHYNAQADLNASVIYYRLVSVDKDGSSSKSKIAKVSFADEAPALEGTSAYPNPFTGNITLSIPSDLNTDLFIEISDLQGRVVSTSAGKLAEGLNTITLSNLDNLDMGVYFVKAVANGEQKTIKMIKH